MDALPTACLNLNLLFLCHASGELVNIEKIRRPTILLLITSLQNREKDGAEGQS